MATELTVLERPVSLTRRLGRGATGDVWLAQSGDGPALVLKFARDRAAYARLAEEGQRLLGVDSPFCVRLLGAGRLFSELSVEADGERSRIARGTPYLVLEHHEGATLDVASPAAASEARVLLVARDIGRALCDLHATGVAHGDVKPANVLIESGSGRPCARLMDFGLAGASDEAEARGGTRRYLAPEAFEAPLAGDARLRDLYALGVTLAEAASPEVARAERPELAFEALPLAAEVKALVAALLSRVPAARPSAEWVYRQAFRVLGEAEPGAEKLERRLGQVRRSYLSLRRPQLLLAARHPKSEIRVEGPAAAWLTAALELLRQVEELRGSIGSGELVTLNDWDSVGRARWLVELVGSPAAAWPELPVKGDGELAGRLLAAVTTREPRRLTFADLESSTAACEPNQSIEPVELALALGRGAAQAATLDAVERLVEEGNAPRALGLSLGRALRLRGQLARALSVLARVEGAEARLEAAEVWRRAGSPASARGLLAELDANALSDDLRERERAIRARLLYDEGNPRAAFDLLEPMPRSVSALEVRALSQIALSQRKDAEATLARAQLLSESDEERARVAAVAGNLAHFDGDLTRALGHTRRAAEHAARAGAVLEEATYLTSVAAAASNVGELGLTRSAACRALLLFESLGRTREAARAELSLSSAYAALGAAIEAQEHALAAAQHAKAAGDKRCRAYAQLVLADILPLDDSDGIEHARFAATLIDDDLDDRLRVAARLHTRGDTAEFERFDDIASAPDRALDARLEWWTARARAASVSPSPLSPRRPLEALLSQVSESAPCLVRGPAFAAGAELAARLGDGDAVRRLTLGASEAARELAQRAGSELAAAVRALPWVRLADAGHNTSPFSLEQLSDVDRLVRALGRRDRLRPLLEQVVDALVLWTGVERGLLLLRAPGGRLQPRAGRNLLRVDLVGAQLALSHSLAERALSLGEPVVAVDAAGDLPEMHESVHALKLRSVLAVPLIARGEALGVVYLDDRARRGAFGPRELSWVRLVATLAAVAIADARDQILLRRAARRARRAEARLSVELAKREAELDVAERELARARDARETRFRYDEIVGRSEATRTMLRLVDRVAASDVPVLLSGESGSGKELIARAIHRHGARSGQAFVAENCGAIPETLLESALFGHVRGAFTGAQRPRAGLFEIAHRGTLLLDEIGEMSLGMQAKLLRALQDGEIRPVGSERSKTVDVRVIGATHRDLAAMVAAGKFREDLYYRLNVISMRIPSLRERIGDAAILVKHFMALHAGTRQVQISRAALDMLSAYGWPGNVRQLENEVRRALVLADDVILPEHLTPEISARGEAKSVDELNLRQRVDALEVELVRIALRRTDGNQTRAAELLGVSRFGLQKMMKRLEISLESGHA
jgi:transcriptional regulator with GAF, ATPase, and Fis domain